MSGLPDPKSRSLASPKDWQRIVAAKRGPCRVCVYAPSNGHDQGHITFHHLVPRAQGGDDIADNIVPVHAWCHDRVTERSPQALAAVEASLTDVERAYVVGKLGESGPARLFGVGR